MPRNAWHQRLRIGLRTLIGHTSVVGVDIGSARIKIVEVAGRGEAVRVLRVASMATPGRRVGIDGLADPEAVAAALRELAEDVGLRSRRAAVALPHGMTFCKRIEVEARNRREMESRVEEAIAAWELDEEQSWSIDWCPMGAQRNDPGRCAVLLVAAPTDVVWDYSACLRAADFVPIAVDVDAVVLETLAARVGEDRGHVVALIDIGARHCSINILRNGHAAHHGSFQGGTATYGDRRSHESIGTELEGEGSPWVIDFVEDLHHHLSFFWMSHGDDGIDEVWLCGGGANVAGLLEQVEARLGATVQVFDPRFVLPAQNAEYGPEYALATALALRGT